MIKPIPPSFHAVVGYWPPPYTEASPPDWNLGDISYLRCKFFGAHTEVNFGQHELMVQVPG